MAGDARRAAERSARDHYGRLLSILAARSRDITSAEDALADALAAALRDWPVNGVPRSPEAWLLAVARRRLIDAARRRINAETALEQIGWLSEGNAQPDADGFADERLKLLFVCAHPAIDVAVRAPLMLQVVLGFSAEEIAPFFLTPPATISQRLVRAKRKLREAGAAFQVPGEEELPERLEAVLGAIYALFTQGWSLPAAERDRRRALASDALWLARLTVSLCPDQPEALGLLALVLHAWARDGARRSADGRYVPLPEQDMAAWDASMIDEAERVIELAARQRRPGRFQIEAAIQSVHAARRLTGTTDWRAILGFYDAILAGSSSPVPAINRCIAVMHVHGPEPALADLEVLAPDRRLDGYQPYWAARAEILSQTGDRANAAAAYDRAIALEPQIILQRLLRPSVRRNKKSMKRCSHLGSIGVSLSLTRTGGPCLLSTKAEPSRATGSGPNMSVVHPSSPFGMSAIRAGARAVRSVGFPAGSDRIPAWDSLGFWHHRKMNWVAAYQFGTAIVLAGTWLFLTARRVRLRGWRGLWFLLTAPLFFVAWYVLEFGALVYGCARLDGAGC